MPTTDSLPVERGGLVAGNTRRRLLLRDGLIFLVLCAVTVTLFGLTLLLFRSFAGHRLEIGRTWSERGRKALEANRPGDAVVALRSALSYMPDDRADQLLLAQALAASGRTEEADNYFLNLWDARPGDGFVNLQLARLERQRGDVQAAVNHYQAAITGSWEGDGVLRRRETRLELADYYAGRKDPSAARAELLVAAGNAPPEESLEILLGDRLRAVGDLPNALLLYEKALGSDPHRWSVLVQAGTIAYDLGHYEEAEKLLSRAVAEPTHDAGQENADLGLRSLAGQARRIPELTLSRELPGDVRAEHTIVAERIARERLQSCAVQLNVGKADPGAKRLGGARANSAPAVEGRTAPGGVLPPGMLQLRERWNVAGKLVSHDNLQLDPNLQEGMVQLIDDTETETARVCGPPSGDDALLLLLAGREHAGSKP